jgi:hypothetical protein
MGNMRNKNTTHVEREAQRLERKVAREAAQEKRKEW